MELIEEDDERMTESCITDDDDRFHLEMSNLVDQYLEKFKVVNEDDDVPGAGAGTGAPPTQVVQMVQPSRLEALKLTDFDGDKLEYPTWRDMFMAMVDSREHMSDIDKFAHLKLHIKGDAEKTIKGMFLTGANYRQALALLDQEYDKPEHRRQLLLHKFKHLPRAEKEARSLRNLYNEIQVIGAELQQLGDDIFHRESTMLDIDGKLPNKLRFEWGVLRDKDMLGTASLESLMKWLLPQIHSLERMDWSNTTQPKAPKKETKPMKEQPTAAALATTTTPGGGSSNKPSGDKPPGGKPKDLQKEKKKYPCVVCDSKSHRSWDCPVFKGLGPAERMTMANDKRMCLRCLIPGHGIKKCRNTTVKCEKCQRRHNPLLHDGDVAPKPTSEEKKST
jgi:hypothetical protein